jgi:hypothetical protein
MAVWYIGKPNELLIDLDDYMRAAKSGEPWGEAFFRKRLRAAIAGGKLAVREVWLVRSTTDRHYHAIVRLKRAMSTIERLIWQLQLGSDLYRGRADLMRAARGIKAPSLLIRSSAIEGFYREPDYRCPCPGKHRTEDNPDCDVWRKLRGMSPWELFGPSSKERERFVALPLGNVPMSDIMRMEIE